MLKTDQGMSLVEVLVASVTVAVLAGGTMTSFLAAIRISEGGAGLVEAAHYGQQTLERLRNKVACGEGSPGEWFSPACAPTLPPPNSFDPSDPTDGIPGSGMYSGSRTYTVTPEDCDGVGGAGDCFKVVVKVQWTPPQ